MPLASRAWIAAFVLFCGLALAVDALAATRAGARTIRVGSQAQLEAAEHALRRSGGTIVLRPRLYRELVVRWRTGKRLRIVGSRGARAGRVVFDGASLVSFGRVRIGPVRICS